MQIHRNSYMLTTPNGANYTTKLQKKQIKEHKRLNICVKKVKFFHIH